MRKPIDLSQLTGKNVLDFIKHQLGEKLPERGFLAGQSVTSIVLYLMGKQNSLHINDYDVFDRHERASSNHLINRYETPLVLKGDSFGINRIKSENITPEIINKLKTRYIEDVKEGSFLSSQEIKIFESLEKSESSDFSYSDPSVGAHRISSYSNRMANSSMGSLTTNKMKRLRSFLRANKVIGNRQNKLAFFAHKVGGAYRIQSSKRQGMINIVKVSFPSVMLRENHSVLSKPECYNIICHFDLNANQVGVNLETGDLIFTDNFLYFTKSNQLKIVTLNRYWHSLIRYFNKKDEHGYYGNDECEIDKVMTYHALKNGIGLDPSLNDNLVNPYTTTHSQGVWEFCSPLIGKKYRELFASSKANELFHIERVDIIKDKHNLDLYELSPKTIEQNAILNGDHKRELEKTFGEKIYGYKNLALTTIIQNVEALHHQSSPRKVIRSQTIFKDIVKNKDSFLSCKNGTLPWKLTSQVIKEISMAGGHYSHADMNRVYAMVIKHPESEGWFLNSPTRLWKDVYQRLRSFKEKSISTYFHLLGFSSFIGAEKLLSLGDEEIKEVVIENMYRGPDKIRDPLIESFELGDISVSEIVSYRRLVQEGDIMHHCVASYHSYIENYSSMILSLIDNTGMRSTAEIELYSKDRQPLSIKDGGMHLDNLQLFIAQHRSKFNANPPSAHRTALRAWVFAHNQKLQEET